MFKFLLQKSSVLLFSEMTPLVRLSRERTIEENDMPLLPDALTSIHVESADKQVVGKQPRDFFKGLVKANWPQLRVLVILKICAVAASLSVPVFLYQTLANMADKSSHSVGWHTLVFAFLMVAANLILALLNQHSIAHMIKFKQIILTSLNTRIFGHSLFLTLNERAKTPMGDIVNHMNSDSDTVSDAPLSVIELAENMAVAVGVMCLLFSYLGHAAWAAVLLLALNLPLSRFMGRRFSKFEERLMAQTDERVSLMSQIMSGIRVVKFFSWGEKLKSEVNSIRQKELGILRELYHIQVVANALTRAMPTLVGVVAFGCYLWFGNSLDAPRVFASLALFGLLEGPFQNIMKTVYSLTSARVSIARIAGFLQKQTLPVQKGTESAAGKAVGVNLHQTSVFFSESNTQAICDVSLQIMPGESVAIVGPVGAGKSVLLQAIMGEVALANGRVQFPNLLPEEFARIAFVPQEAFILNATLENNIRMGGNEISLERATAVACLESDVAILPHGMRTEIGEHGVNLSGGQKQRVSLARAAMRKPGLVLLDDPLSAVDVHTEKELVELLIFDEWKSVTRIVVTHRLAHLEKFDKIVFMEAGSILAADGYSELLQNSPRFAAFVAEHSKSSEAAQDINSLNNTHKAHSEQEPESPDPAPGQADTSRITVDEDRKRGAVNRSLYFRYLSALGGQNSNTKAFYICLLFLGVALSAGTPILQNSWIAAWTQGAKNDTLGKLFAPLLGDTWHNFMIYAFIGLLILVVISLDSFYWNQRRLVAGRELHANSLSGVLGAPLRFFDSTPVGRILNLFSRDVSVLDHTLPLDTKGFAHSTIAVLANLIFIILFIPELLFFLPFCAFGFYNIQKDYRAVARESRRLASIYQSPRFAFFKETLTGLQVIRAFAQQERFLTDFRTVLDKGQRMFYGNWMIGRWFSVRLPLLTGALSLFIAIFVVVSAQSGNMLFGTAGIILTYSTTLLASLSRFVGNFSLLESSMTSLERLQTYALLESEKSITKQRTAPLPEGWPQKGAIEFRDVSVRYEKHMPLILKGMSFQIQAGSKVGIVGRTGSGKSTLFQALYRFIELDNGEIIVDGENIASVPLDLLRKSMAIIPQDPTLFLGTLRSNLDKFDQFTDAKILDALKKVQLKNFVESLPGGLSAAVNENGLNFSQGQRQLLCFARALLIDSKIIVMDEATASVDVETDMRIQEIVRTHCEGITVLIIAHRLGTVADCDQIIELS